jgi:asparagine synthetase B (glutamine-hydrolysing)
MCGILGITSSAQLLKTPIKKRLLKEMYLLSESRGKEASGLAIRSDDRIKLLRTPFAATELVHSKVYSSLLESDFTQLNYPIALIGHSRLVTNGYEHDNRNNQPVTSGVAIAVHNGIIVNHEEIWSRHPDLLRCTDLDSEIIPALINKYDRLKLPVEDWMPKLFSEIKGTASTAVLLSNRNVLMLATNNGSLYFARKKDNGEVIFASERYILETAIQRSKSTDFHKDEIKQLSPGSFLLIDFAQNLVYQSVLSGKQKECFSIPVSDRVLPIIEIEEKISNRTITKNKSLEHTKEPTPVNFERKVIACNDNSENLRRCSRCILPETFPFIVYDNQGVCNYCNNHEHIQVKGENALLQIANIFREKGRLVYDCLVPFSGGRDSSFALHYLVRELGLKPLAFSYDWGMLTDLGRRNQSRMCGALGVEHMLVSADIRKKRENIRKNVTAWLKRPNLGTIPLFMAGDKQYFYHTSKLMTQNNLGLSVMGENMLETTRFKTGFCGIPPHFGNNHTYSIPFVDKLRMMLFYGKEYLLNPAYINSSLLDTFDAFKSYYVIKHDNLNIFDFLVWDENTIEQTLLNEYDWETDPGTPTTWRIGDGTAAFYNYIYYSVAGFTENDTFRSNQIREGQITREYALEKVKLENQPRWDSIQWYFNVIGIDWKNAISIINNMKPLYK